MRRTVYSRKCKSQSNSLLWSKETSIPIGRRLCYTRLSNPSRFLDPLQLKEQPKPTNMVTIIWFIYDWHINLKYINQFYYDEHCLLLFILYNEMHQKMFNENVFFLKVGWTKLVHFSIITLNTLHKPKSCMIPFNAWNLK